MQAERDATLMSAWSKGGLFDGKPATDEAVLAYWKARMSDLSTSDPLYESIKDQVGQIEYGIAQSKQDVLYKQGKISDSQYASFFLNWSKKVPKNSEFYRTLQKDAAGLIEAAKGRRAGSANKSKVDAYNKYVGSITADKIDTGNALKDAVTQMATTSGLDLEADGGQILGLLTADLKAEPSKYKKLLDSLKVSDPGFDGNITAGFFAKKMQLATDGYTAIADRAKKDGYASNYAGAAAGAAEMTKMASDIKVWPVAQSYDAAYAAFSKVWTDPNSSEPERNAAAQAFSATAARLAATSGIDPVTKQMLQSDADRALGKPAGDTVSFAAVTGRAPLDDGTAAKIKDIADKKALHDANPGAYVYAPTDSNGQYDPTGAGHIGVVPAGAVGAGAAQVVVTGLDGKAIVASIAPHPVYAVNPNDPNDRRIIGAAIDYTSAGHSETLFKYVDSTGANQWVDAAHAPWADGVTPLKDSKGDYNLIPPPQARGDIIAQAKAIDAAKGTHLADLINNGTDVSAKVSQSFIDETGAKITVSLDKGAFTAVRSTETPSGQTGVPGTGTSQTYDLNLIFGANGVSGFAKPWDPGDAISASKAKLGTIPGVTFTSPLAVSMASAQTSMSQDQTSDLSKDPYFQQTFLSQTMASTGATSPFDQRIADAWENLTNPPNALMGVPAADRIASQRSDLNYPGVQKIDSGPNAGGMAVTFNNQTIKVPSLPQVTSAAQSIGANLPSFLQNLINPAKPGAALTPLAAPPAPVTGPGSTSLGITPPPVTPIPQPTVAAVNPMTVPKATPTPVATPAPVAPPSPKLGPKAL